MIEAGKVEKAKKELWLIQALRSLPERYVTMGFRWIINGDWIYVAHPDYVPMRCRTGEVDWKRLEFKTGVLQ